MVEKKKKIVKPKKTVKKTKTVVKKTPVKKPVVKKPVVKKTPVKKPVVKKTKGVKEIWVVGKRKTSIARVQFFSIGQGEIIVNKKSFKDYFPLFELQGIVSAPLKLLKKQKDFKIRINIHGGGTKGQAEAIRLGISRALVSLNPEWRQELKSAGFLKRDPRKKERKKPGLKRARRAPQWQKR